MTETPYTTPRTRGDIVAVLIPKALQMDSRYRATNIYRRAVLVLAHDHDADEERHEVARVLDLMADLIDRTMKFPCATVYRRAAALIREDFT